jgi:hypothetical protein
MKRNSKDKDEKEAIQVQPIDMEHHRMALRKSLITSPYWQKHAADRFFFLKGVRMMQKRPLVKAGVALSIVAIVIALVLIFIPQRTTPVEAAVVAQKSYQAVQSLTNEQQATVEANLKTNAPQASLKSNNIASEMLQKAQNAKDLKTLTYDQFASQYPAGRLAILTAKYADLKSFTYLQFTDSDGTVLVLGINPNTNLPEFAEDMNVHDLNGKP